MNFLRYPGGKGRMLSHLRSYIPSSDQIVGHYIEPFVGGGAVFLYVQPKSAVLADVNSELIDLYKAIRAHPERVWEAFRAMPEGKDAYHRIRKLKPGELDCVTRAARLLYLNRTCFKGMWRHNGKGEFNIGYGGASRRWVITEEDLLGVSRLLRRASLRCSDFEEVIDLSSAGDFIFVDPPYRPGHRELANQHYVGQAFTFEDQARLASALARAEARGVWWTMTNSAHPDILSLYPHHSVTQLARGTGPKPGALIPHAGEVIITSGRKGQDAAVL
ncbi:MAG: DNA adenine methylase [Chloroflexi bacterium]|nr:MAG: DNA adenine methylase [Chloroflexota bacterium]